MSRLQGLRLVAGEHLKRMTSEAADLHVCASAAAF
jgi:hypothetical protein